MGGGAAGAVEWHEDAAFERTGRCVLQQATQAFPLPNARAGASSVAVDLAEIPTVSLAICAHGLFLGGETVALTRLFRRADSDVSYRSH